MRIVCAAVCGFVLDQILGDPPSLTPLHPVVWMGRCITGMELHLRKHFPKTPEGELFAGRILAAALPLSSALFSAGQLRLLRKHVPILAFGLETAWCWQILAVKNLRDEAMGVYLALTEKSLPEAQKAVGRIVGRDTERLDRDGVARAAVETVAESFCDGITAPLFWMLLGGVPLAMAYKAVNTLDSMVGYRNERYLNFGRASAHLDDAVNFLPSRLAALLLIASARLCGEDAESAFHIWCRDRRKHPSPNAGQCEAAMAGALGLKLCGPAYYFGELMEKPALGDARRPIEPEDICRACRMEQTGSLLCLLLLCLIRMGIWRRTK